MASFSAGTTFTDGVANDVTAAKLGALVNNATPTSGLIQDRTAETVTATNDTLLIGDASDSNNLKRITVANFAQTLPTAKITTGTIETGTFGTTTSTAATITLVTTGTGTAASPAIVPTGDTNTGVFFPAADTIGFSGGGNELMRIDSSGRVGIGTTTPGVKLHISSGSADAQMRIESTGGASYDQSIHFKDTASDWYIGNKYSGATNSFGVGRTQAKDDLVIDSSGNVGIGVTNPLVKLHINGITRIGSGNDYQFDSTLKINAESTGATGYLRFYTDSTERLRIDSNGNVGINTSSPDALLDVKRTNSDGLIAEMGSGDLAGDVVLEIKSADSRASINIGATGGTGAASRNLAFSTSGTERLRIDSSGNVGIGTTSPTDAKLSVYANNLTIPAIAARYSAVGYKMGFGVYNVLGYPYLGLNCNQVTSSNNQTYDLSAHATKLDMSIDGSTPGFVFSTAASGTAGSAITWSERLRIDSSGFVSIGTATALSALHVHGNVTLSNTTTATSAGTGGLSKPATYAGYLTVSINGTSRKIPYYAT